MNQKIKSISTCHHVKSSILIIPIISLICIFSLASASFSAEVTLAWDANPDPDLSAYKIYYKTGSSGAPYDGTAADQGASGINVPIESLGAPDSPSFVLTGLPDGETFYFVVTAVDTSGNESGYSNEVSYSVSSSDPYAPVVSDIANQTIAEGASFATFNLDSYVSDPDHTDAEITWSVTGNSELTVTIDANRVATITIPYTGWKGSETITFTATDPDSLSDSDGATFTVAATAPNIDFNQTSLVAYADQDLNGTVTVEDSGATLHLEGNRWRRTEKTYTVTTDTVLEFDFRCDVKGEIHGIGFDIDDYISNDRIFKLFGTQSWGISVSDPYTDADMGTLKHFSIPVGQYYTGSDMHLVFVNDDDRSSPVGNSRFRNVQVVNAVSNDPPVVAYTITSSGGSNGAITPAGATTLTQGENQSYVITPDTNYRIKDVLVDGVSIGPVAEYTFSNVSSDHTISASFEINTYIVPRTITASSGANGSISPAGLINVIEGSDITFQITPDTNYRIKDVLVDGVSVGAISVYTFSNVTADHTITASFEVNSYVITASSGLHGSISPTGTVSVAPGGNKTFTITAEAGYQIGQLTVDGKVVTPTNSYSFTNVTSNHSISANFVSSPYTITATAGENGSISPNGSVSVEHGSSQTFTISADSGHSVADVMVDGASVGAVTSYTFANVTTSHSISALFKPENQAPIADAGPDQKVESGVVVSLNGLNSIDLDDGIASFLWEQISGSTVALSNPADPETTFVSPEVGQNGESLTFQLTVTDNGGTHSVDTCIVNVIWVNTPPVSSAGQDQVVDEGTTVTLDGSMSSDEDDGIASYQWKQVGGIPVDLSEPSAAKPSFITPDVGPDGSTLSFQLTVTDNGGLQSDDTCIVNVSWVNTPPVSVAEPNVTVDEGTTVTLDGSKSSDADDGIVMYLWKQVSGVPVTLSDSTAIQPNFTAPKGIAKKESLEFSLSVKDKGGLQGSDSCVVSVEPAIQAQPLALHIASISIEFDKKGRNYKAIAYVKIVDDSANVVEGATVTGDWTVNGTYLSTSSVSTYTNGISELVSNPAKVKSVDEFAFSITDVSKDGFIYEHN